MISLLPNQRFEVVPSTSVQLKYSSITAELLEYIETRPRTVTTNGYEAVASALPRILAPTVGGTSDRVVQSFQVAPVNSALTATVTLQIVTVPPMVVGVTWPGEQVQILDVLTIAAGNILLAEGGDAGWSIRLPAAASLLPVGTTAGDFLEWSGTAPYWSSVKITPFTVALGVTASVTPIAVTGSVNSYFEQNNQNTSAGTGASSDFVATANIGTASANFIDWGINGSGWTGTTWGAALDGYGYVNGGHLWLGTDTAGKNTYITAGGGAAGNVIGTFTSTGLSVTGLLSSSNGLTISAGAVSVPAGSISTAALTGTLAAAQMPAYSGDVSSAANTTVLTLAANIVTYAKLQQVAAVSIVGNPTGSLANAQGITLGATLAFSGSALQTAAHTGDVTTAANSFATTIAAGAVSLAKMANLAANSIIGNNTGSAAVPLALTAAQVNTLLGTPTLTAATNTFTGNAVWTGATSTLGFGAGNGGAVTQVTSRTTGVTLNKSCGEITLFAAIGAVTATSFTVTNSQVAATDNIVLNVKSATNKYLVFVTAKAAGSFEITFYTTGGVSSDSPVIGFTVLKSANA